MEAAPAWSCAWAAWIPEARLATIRRRRRVRLAFMARFKQALATDARGIEVESNLRGTVGLKRCSNLSLMCLPKTFLLHSAWLFVTTAVLEELRVPAATAYLEPDSRGMRVSERRGITGWTNPDVRVLWFGKLSAVGSLRAQVELSLEAGAQASWRLAVGNQTNEVSIRGTGEERQRVDFGEFTIVETGYQRFTLTSEKPLGTIRNLVLEGPAMDEAHFNLKPRRNAASVHLRYPIEPELEVSAFYCEMTGLEDPVWTYYMACGWHRGYFGMQVNSATERRIIFSVWDSGNEAIDRDKVRQEDRVTLVAKGESVYSGDFGNEGTGGHSHLKYLWKTGEKQRFLVTAEPVGDTHTVFAGYYFHPEAKDWFLISSWKAPKEGRYLRGLYSFSENFVGRNGHVLRKALYENQWVRTREGQWIELTESTFSHDRTGREDRLDRFMGLSERGAFFLAHGGFTKGYTEYGHSWSRPPSGRSPEQMNLPRLPAPRRPQLGDPDFPKPTPSQRHDEKVAAVKNGDYDLVLIGDSITHTLGEYGGKYEPMKAVWEKYFAPRRAINLGYSGYRTEQILWNLQNGELEFGRSPKVAMLLIGTNNSDDRHFKTVHTAEEIYDGTKAIVETIRKRHPTTKILVLRVFPRGGDDEKGVSPPAFNSSAECIEICRRAGKLTERLHDGEHVFWLDVNEVFMNADGSINTDRMWDLLHPSPAGGEAWAKAVEPTLAKLLGER